MMIGLNLLWLNEIYFRKKFDPRFTSKFRSALTIIEANLGMSLSTSESITIHIIDFFFSITSNFNNLICSNIIDANEHADRSYCFRSWHKLASCFAGIKFCWPRNIVIMFNKCNNDCNVPQYGLLLIINTFSEYYVIMT